MKKLLVYAIAITFFSSFILIGCGPKSEPPKTEPPKTEAPKPAEEAKPAAPAPEKAAPAPEKK